MRTAKHLTYTRLIPPSGPDHYVTPAWGTRALIAHEQFEGTILEPCCGTGEMAEVLKETKCHVEASDIRDCGYGRVADFLRQEILVDNIITNPPYNIADEITYHALKLARRKVCLLLRTVFLEGSGRYHKLYCTTPPSRVLVFSSRLSMYPAGSDRTSGGTQSFSWFVWDKIETHSGTRIQWLPPNK